MSYYVTHENSVLNINNAHLKVSGNVMTDVLKLGAMEFAPPASDVPGTVNFTNVTTGVTTTSNLNVGGTLMLGTVEVVATTHTLENTTALGNVTSNTIQFTNPTTSLVASGNVEVAKELTVSGNVAVNGRITREYNPGEIIEELTTVCNGRPVTVLSGTYTPTNVTASQTSSATHTEINGSNITYNKPAGAKRIYYKFACQWDDASRGAITHFKIRVYHNGAWRDINPSRYTHATQYLNDGNHHGQAWVINEYIFECDAETESQHDGRFLSSKTSYTFDVTWRQFGVSDYVSRLHINEWWDGTGTDVVHPPQLTIRAIA